MRAVAQQPIQLLHLAISTAWIAVFLRRSPFSLAFKALFVFGYFPIFEYTVKARGYGLGFRLARTAE